MTLFNVLLDTNIFMAAKYNFAGGSLLNLKKYCENGIVTLFTNDIILREVQSHIDEDVSLMARQAKNAIRQHGELVNAITRPAYDTIEATLLNASKSLHAQFEAYMAGSTVLSNAGLSVELLFADYFEKHAPFESNEKKKSEFPDAAVILSIKQYIASTQGATLHVVSDDNGWHNALKGIDGVSVYKSLSDLLTKIAEDEKDVYARVTKYMETCVDELRSSAENWIVCQDWSAFVDNIEMCVECDGLVDIYVTTIDLSPEGVEYIDREGEFAAALFSGVATFFLGFDYVDHTNEVYDREDRVYYNTIYGKGAAELKVPFTGAVTILIPNDGEMTLNSSDFDEVTLGDVGIVDYKLTPYRNDDDPYFAICPDCGKPIGIHNDGGNGFCSDCAAQH